MRLILEFNLWEGSVFSNFQFFKHKSYIISLLKIVALNIKNSAISLECLHGTNKLMKKYKEYNLHKFISDTQYILNLFWIFIAHIPLAMDSAFSWPVVNIFQLYNSVILLLLLQGQKSETIIQNGPPVAPQLSLPMLVPEHTTKSQNRYQKYSIHGNQDCCQYLNIL